MKITIDTREVQGTTMCVLKGKTLEAYLVKRDERPALDCSSVYVLMDIRRTCYYVGETGNAVTGGFSKRFANHCRDKKEKWFDLCVCFVDNSRLCDEKTRKWVEWALWKKARDEHYAVLSSATETYGDVPPPSYGPELVNEICQILQIVGIPWSFSADNEERMLIDSSPVASVAGASNVGRPSFGVKMPSGVMLSLRKSSDTFAAAIKQFGPSAVAERFPNLVRRSRTGFPSYASVRDLGGGWFVNVHGSTRGLARTLKDIVVSLNLGVEIVGV